ncbi:MAG: hypothetical protein ACR2MM_08370 [Flavobacteriaceae bacterium]
MFRKLIWFCLLLFISSCSEDDSSNGDALDDNGFTGEIEWMRNFGGTGSEKAQAVIGTTDGGWAVLGYTNSTDGELAGKPLAVNDYWLLKFDSEGNLQWNRTYGGSKDDRGQAVIQTSDGGYAMAGYAMSSDGDGSNNEGFHDHWILKLNSSGDLEWEKSFGFAGHDHAYDLVQTEDGGFFFTGFLDIVASGGAGGTEKGNSPAFHGVGEFWGTKIDALGNIQWRKFFGGTNNDRAYGLVRSFDGGYIMTGFAESDDSDISNTKGSYDYWLVKVDNGGNLVWERSFGGSGIDVSYDIERTEDNAYVVVGHTFSTDKDVSVNHGESDIWLIKISESGELLWEKTYGGSAYESANSVKQTADGGFLIAGNSRSSDQDVSDNSGENDMWILKTNVNGDLQWQTSLGGTGLDFGFDAMEQGENELILVGQSGSADFNSELHKGGTDLVMVKFR